MIKSILLFASILLLSKAYAADFYPILASGNYSTDATWSGTGFPDDVSDNIVPNTAYLISSYTLTQDVDAVIGNYNFIDWSVNNIATIITGATKSLSVNNFTMTGPRLTTSVTLDALTVRGNLTLDQGGTFTLKSGTTMNVNGTFFIGNGFNLIVESGATLTITGTTSANGGNITVKNGGKIVFNNAVTLEGAGLNMTVEENGYTDINSTLTITAGANTLNIAGKLDINNLVANGGAQSLNILDNGVVKIFNNASFDGSATFDVNGGGELRIGGNLSIAGGAHGTVDSGAALYVGGTITPAPPTSYLTQALGSTVISGMGSSVALPIELHYFKLQYLNGIVYFDWATFSEENNDYFTIESSQNATDFEPELIVLGAGNSNAYLSYQASMPFNKSGITYYRLKQTDYNGQFSYSGTVALAPHNTTPDNINMLSVTKLGNTINLELDQTIYTAKIEMVTTAGCVVHSQLEVNYDGLHQLQFNPGYVAPGIYIIRITNSSGLNLSTKLAF